ncbi:MAG TPA: tRNA (N6-threonylcarbamoyladenosine(37)-N6)-methyltransferase TrmO, partial [Hyphomicrobiaceae bacterium]|nr:tRNA (N6-threonylcarbamoyladenosine(37)-N6)-methyltransferase TrmO [Hyphomicrobiaceae bacterium]
PERTDARLVFIGRIRTPYATRADCPRQPDEGGPACRLEVEPTWQPALAGIKVGDRVEVIYWMHQARRDLVVMSPKRDGRTTGAFTLRSPARPNPIAISTVTVERVEPGALVVRSLDCVDGTPLLDIKPERCHFTPQAVTKSA